MYETNISRHDYTAFGDEVTETIGNVGGRTTAQGYGEEDEIRKGYTGYEKDEESGLDFAQARYYNSQHGRFTSVDPLTASANVKNPQTFNRYSYVLNSPYKFVDPLGLIPETPVKLESYSSGDCQGKECNSSFDWNYHYAIMALATAVIEQEKAETQEQASNGGGANDDSDGEQQEAVEAETPPEINNEKQEKIDAISNEAEEKIKNEYLEALDNAEKIPPPSYVRASIDPFGIGEILETAVGVLGVSIKATDESKIDKLMGNSAPGFWSEVNGFRSVRDANIKSIRQDALIKLTSSEIGLTMRDAIVTVNNIEVRAAVAYNDTIYGRGSAPTASNYFIKVQLSPWNKLHNESMINRVLRTSLPKDVMMPKY